MILTVTLNPSIDKLYLMGSITPETVMRVKEVHNTAGGKGLNVSRVAAQLGERVTATGFIGGHNGDYLVSLIESPLVTPAFTRVSHETRSCINCWDLSNGRSTEYLEPGDPVTEENVRSFFDGFMSLLPRADVVTVSGSMPKGVPEDAYERIIRLCRERNVRVFIDTSGSRLVRAAKALPDLIKPNTDEIEQLLGYRPEGVGEAARAAKALHDTGIKYVVISLGADGAVLACADGVFHGCPPRITPKNTVGCGDSMLAGFAAGFAKKLPVLDTFRMSLAVSAASALDLFTGSYDEKDYQALYPNITIRQM